MARTKSSSPPRWSLQDAKNKLSALVDEAARGTPQIVTRRGVETAVVISYGEYQRIEAQRRIDSPSLADYLLDIPSAGDDWEIERIQIKLGEVELDD